MRNARAMSLCLLVVFFCTIALVPNAARPAIHMQAASDPNGRFTISFPVEWQVVRAKTGGPAVAGIAPAPQGQFHPNVNVTVEQLPEPLSAAAYAQRVMPLMVSTFPAFAVVQEGVAHINHRDGYYRYFTWRSLRGGFFYQVQVYFTVGRLGYVVTGTTLNTAARIRHDMPLIGQIFETFTPTAK